MVSSSLGWLESGATGGKCEVSCDEIGVDWDESKFGEAIFIPHCSSALARSYSISSSSISDIRSLTLESSRRLSRSDRESAGCLTGTSLGCLAALVRNARCSFLTFLDSCKTVRDIDSVVVYRERYHSIAMFLDETAAVDRRRK